MVRNQFQLEKVQENKYRRLQYKFNYFLQKTLFQYISIICGLQKLKQFIKINQGANTPMTNHNTPNNDFFSSQLSLSSNFDRKHLLTINLKNSIHYLKDSLKIVPDFEHTISSSLEQKTNRFYREYLRQFQKNKRLNHELVQIIQDRNMLADKYNSIKTTKTTEDSVHRKRRYARDIERLFYCPIQKCRKGYGSEGSLAHHIRLKHLDFFQSGKYEIFIQKYIDDMKESKKKFEEKASQNKQIVKQIQQSLQKGQQMLRKSSLRIKKKFQDQK